MTVAGMTEVAVADEVGIVTVVTVVVAEIEAGITMIIVSPWIQVGLGQGIEAVGMDSREDEEAGRDFIILMIVLPLYYYFRLVIG